MSKQPLYHIQNLCPRSDQRHSRCNFHIHLWPEWKEAVKKSKLTQANIDELIKNCHRHWLDGCGYGRRREDNTPAYGQWAITVAWGEWGPELIRVPGDASQLNIGEGIGRPAGGKTLEPHNIDTTDQVMLILVVFTTIADYLIHHE